MPPRVKKEDSDDAEQLKALAAEEAQLAKAEKAQAKEAAKEERRAAKEAAREERVRAAAEAEAQRHAAKAERETAQAEADAELAAAEAEHEALLAATAIAESEAAAPEIDSEDDTEVAEDQVDSVDDHIDPLVEPPPSIDDDSEGASASNRERLTSGLLVLGAVGLICSVILAIGALITAVEADSGGGVIGAFSSLCDVLVGPLGGLFSFSGENGAAKGDLVARGVASILYLAIGLSMPALARKRDA